MPRLSAARTSEAVEGPRARRCAKRMNSSRASCQFHPSGTVPAGRIAAGSRDAFVALRVFVDNGIDAGTAGAAGLAERDLLAGNILKFDGDVLENMPEPRTLIFAHASKETSRLPIGTSMFDQTGQCFRQGIDKFAAEPAGRPGLEIAQVEFEANNRK